MDTTKTTTHISLCAGYGGIDLGLKRAIPTLRTIAFSEIEAFACANLVAKMEAGLLDAAPIWTDLKTFPWSEFRDRVDILSGGYPCQPFSAAGKRLGHEDPRHLWPHISAGIAAMRPSVCFFENVEGHISLGLPDVIEDLAGLGYRTTWGIFSAAEVGAPHQRKRVFILAHRNGDRLVIDVAGAATVTHSNGPQDGISGADGELADSQRAGLEGQHHRDASSEQAQDVGADTWASGECGAWELGNASSQGHTGPARSSSECAQGQSIGHAAESNGGVWPSRPGEQQFAWEPPRVVADTKGNQRRLSGDSQSTAERWRAAKLGRADDAGARDLLADATSTGSGSEGGDAVHQRWSSSDTWAASVSQDAERQAGAAIADNQSASRDGGELGDAMLSGSSPERSSSRKQDRLWEPSDRAMGHPTEPRCEGSRGPNDSGWPPERSPEPNGSCTNGAMESKQRQTQPPLGRDADGPADWLDDAELFTTCDNRTDELRLLGNGVVPATAERAFRVLFSELTAHNTQQPHT